MQARDSMQPLSRIFLDIGCSARHLGTNRECACQIKSLEVEPRFFAFEVSDAGAALDAMAVRLMHVQAQAALAVPLLEFHAEAGAPEGALYVDGHLVGHLAGVTRL